MAGAVNPLVDVLGQAWPGEVTEAGLVALAATLGRRLADAGARVVTAESCTGGAIARALTETAGSSAWFDRGFVTYSNDAKQVLLGVPDDLLARHGAVSEPVAAAMAEGALRAIGLPGLALAVTGIAGPGGAVPGKPVGTVCFGWAGGGDSATAPWVHTATVRFDGDRTAVRLASARHALAGGLALWAPAWGGAPGAAPGG